MRMRASPRARHRTGRRTADRGQGPADVVDGPAVVNGRTLTCAVPPGWTLRVDDFGNAELARVEGATPRRKT